MGTVHFDPTWTGTQSGTFAQPYVSWASRTHVPGDSWVQRYGTTTTDPYAPFGVLGDAANRRFVGVYDPMTGAIMRGVKGGAFIDATGKTYGANITESRGFITFSGFEVFGAVAAGLFKGSVSSDPANAQATWLEYCIFRDNRGAGIDMRGQGHKLIDSDVLDNDTDGMLIRGNDFELGRCVVANNGRVGDTGDCVQFVDSSNFNVYDSDFDHSLSDSKQAFISNLENHPGTTGGRIENVRMACKQHVAGVTLADQKTLLIMTPGVTARRCTVEGGQYGAFMQGANGVLEDCLLVVTGAGLVEGVGIRASGVAVRRNTVIGRGDQGGAYGIDHSSSTYTGVTIHGNAVKGWARGIRTTTSGFVYSHNNFENVGVRNSNSAGNEGAAGTGDVVGDLMLDASYRPRPGSPLLRMGLYLGPARDRDGKQRPNPPSGGAFDTATFRRAIQ